MIHLFRVITKKLSVSLFYIFLFITFKNGLYSQNWTNYNEDENYTARHECGFVQVGDKFYLVGGRETQVVDIFDYTTNTWTQGASSPILLHHFQAVEYEGLIWVIGALIDNNDPIENHAEYVYMYNPASDQWIQGIEIPEARRRGAGGLVLYNDTFYFVGGNVRGHAGLYQSWLDAYDPISGTWTQLADAPHQRDHFYASLYNDKIYILEGRQSGGPEGPRLPMVPEVDIYDFTTETWSTLDASKNLPTPRSAAAVAVFQDEIYVIAGETFGSFNDVEAFNPISETWSTKAPVNNYRDGMQALVSGNGIFLVAGSFAGEPIKDMEFYNENNPIGSPNIASTFAADENVKTFVYSESDGSVVLQIILSNSNGTTGTFIDNITLTGADYSLSETYQDIFLGANSNKVIEVTLNNTTLANNNGSVVVTYNNTSSLIISLEGQLDSTLEIIPNNLEHIILFPNPTKNTFTINTSVSQLQIFDIMGKQVKVFSGNYTSEQAFDISNFPQGMYFIKGINQEGHKVVAKLIKQ